jgi:hypothetical protein
MGFSANPEPQGLGPVLQMPLSTEIGQDQTRKLTRAIYPILEIMEILINSKKNDSDIRFRPICLLR